MDAEDSRNATINGRTVTIQAGNCGIQTFSSGTITDTCDGYITGGDVMITSDHIGIAVKSIVVDSTGKVNVYGDSAALYIGVSEVEGKIEILQEEEISLTGSRITYPEKTAQDGLKEIIIASAAYTEVNVAIEESETLNPDWYLDFSGVTAAINKVVRDKNISEQAEVDAVAQAVEDAIAALEYKSADYAKVNEAISKAETLNPDDYKDFSAVETAVNAVCLG